MRLPRSIIISALVAISLSGCSDALNIWSCRSIAESFCLERWEDEETFYLNGPVERDGGGFLGGTVLAIGWNEHFILAKRRANFRGDPDGWMVVDIRNKSIEGPFDDDEIRRDSRLRNIVTNNPDAAWRSLGYF